MFFGKKEDKELNKWRIEHMDLPQDATAQDQYGNIRDKYGNYIPNESQQNSDNRIVTLAEIQKQIEEIKNLLRQKYKKPQLTEDQQNEIDELIKKGVYKSKEDAVRDLLN